MTSRPPSYRGYRIERQWRGHVRIFHMLALPAAVLLLASTVALVLVLIDVCRFLIANLGSWSVFGVALVGVVVATIVGELAWFFLCKMRKDMGSLGAELEDHYRQVSQQG